MAEITDLSNTDINKISIDDLESTSIEQFEIDKLINIPLIKGLSAYQIAVLNGFVGTEQQWLDSLKVEFQASANAFLEEAKENEETRKDNELLRIENEDTRINNENTRIETENTRIEAEETRISNEEARQEAEAERVNEFDEIKNTYTEERLITIENNVSDLEENKVDKEDGKSLSSNDFTNSYKETLDNISNISLPTGGTTGQILSKVSNNNYDVEWKDNFDLSSYYDKTETDTLLNNKVDKVEGKGLSTNDFTDEYKNMILGYEVVEEWEG